MAITIDYDDLVTTKDTPVLTGTSNSQLCDVEITVQASAVTGGPDDVFTTKCVGGQYVHNTDPLIRAQTKPFVTSGGTPIEDSYVDGPLLIRTADNRIITVFRRGTGHATNDGRLLYSFSDDEGATWGAEQLLYDSPTGFDTRNQAGGVCPDTGNIIIFSRVYNVATTTTDMGYLYSTDNGSTWSSFVSVFSLFSDATDSNFTPFGQIIKTSRGLMQTFYSSQDAWVLFSTDNGVTWGDKHTLWTGNTPANSAVELWAYQIDLDRVVCTIRDSGNANSFRYIKSSDGGDTWSAISDPHPWTGVTISGGAPLCGISYRGQVLAAITGRSPDFELHSCRLGLEDFWDRPWLLWSNENPLRVDGLYSATATIVIDWGYCVVLPIMGYPETALMAWYDDDGASSETSIYMRIFPGVS